MTTAQWKTYALSGPFGSLSSSRVDVSSCQTLLFDTLDLLWFLDLIFSFYFYRILLVHQTLLPICQSYPQLVGFLLALSLHCLRLFASLLLRACWTPADPRKFILQCPFFLSFHILQVLKQKMWGALQFSLFQYWTMFLQNSPPPDPSILGGPVYGLLFYWFNQSCRSYVIKLVNFCNCHFHSVFPSDGWWNLQTSLMGETDYRNLCVISNGSWEPYSSKSLIQFPEFR